MIDITVLLYIDLDPDSLRECLERFTSQLYYKLEFLCIHQVSDTTCSAMIEEYAAADSRVKSIGVSCDTRGQAWNEGIRAACGRFLYFADAQSILTPDAFLNIAEKITPASPDILCFSYDILSTESLLLTPGEYFFDLEETLCISQPAFTRLLHPSAFLHNKLFDKYFVESKNLVFDPIHYAAERWFVFRALIDTGRIQIIPDNLLCYRTPKIEWLSCLTCSLQANASILKLSDKNKSVREVLKYSVFQNLFMLYGEMPYECRQKAFPMIQHFLEDNRDSFYQCRALLPPLIQAQGTLLLKGSANDSFTRTVPIIFAPNRNYLPCTAVAIASIREYSNRDFLYEIYILHTELTEDDEAQMRTLSKENIRITFLNTSGCLPKMLRLCAHYSPEIYQRFLIPQIMLHYEKVLYLDCDILVQADPALLMDFDLSNHAIGAVPNFMRNSTVSYVTSSLHLDHLEYFNSGVLLMNLPLFSANHYTAKALSFLQQCNKLNYWDQDALNLLCNKSVLYLPDDWNFQYHHLFCTSKEDFLIQEHKDRYLKASLSPKLIHYTSRWKPWNTQGVPYYDLFWNYARLTPYYEELRIHLQKEIQKQQEQPPKSKELTLLADEVSRLEERKKQLTEELATVSHSVASIRASFTFRCARFISKIANFPALLKRGMQKGDLE